MRKCFLLIILAGTILNIKDYNPPIHVDRKHMKEVWLRKITGCVGSISVQDKIYISNQKEISDDMADRLCNGTVYRLYETLNTENVYQYKRLELFNWDVDTFGRKDVRGCVEDMQP